MRDKQKARTRKAIVHAAGELLRTNAAPTIDEIASQANVSRATAYRYFPSLGSLLSEASAELAMPRPDFTAASSDPFERLALLDEELDRGCRAHEALMRRVVARAIGAASPRDSSRQPLIEQALAPLAARLGQVRLERLAQALTMVIGTEGFIALNDVAGLGESEAREVRRWAIDALVAATLNEAYSAG